jgi:hypothetical protein
MQDDGSKEVLDALTGHEKREQARKAKEEAHHQKDAAQESREAKKSYFWTSIVIIILIAFAGGIWWLYTHKPEVYTAGSIHWHAFLDINICGEKRDVRGGEMTGTMAESAMYGPHLLHHHNDNTIHIEGQVIKKEDIQLGKFFDGIDIPFDKDKIMDKKNGDLCPDGRPGVLKMYVNDQPRTDFREYVPFAVSDARKQVIKLVFEPEGGMGPVENVTVIANITNQSS